MMVKRSTHAPGAAAWAVTLTLAVILATASPVWAASHSSPSAQPAPAGDEPGFYITADRVVAKGVSLSLLPEGLNDPFGIIVRFQEAWVDNLAITEDLGDEAGRPTWVQISSDGTAHITQQAMRTDLFSLIASLEAPSGDPIGYLLELLGGAAQGKLVLRNVAMRVLRADVGHGEIPAMRVRYVQDPSQLRDWDRILRSREQSRGFWARYRSLDKYPRGREQPQPSQLPGEVSGLLACVQQALGIDAGQLLGQLAVVDPAGVASEVERQLRGLLATHPQAALACLPDTLSQLSRGEQGAGQQSPAGEGSVTPPKGTLPELPLPVLPKPPTLPITPPPVQDLADCVVDALNGLLHEPGRLQALTRGLDELAVWLDGLCRAGLASGDGKATDLLPATLQQVLGTGLLDETIARAVANLLAGLHASGGVNTGGGAQGPSGSDSGPAGVLQGVASAAGGVVGSAVDAGGAAVNGTLEVVNGVVSGVTDALKATGQAVRSFLKKVTDPRN